MGRPGKPGSFVCFIHYADQGRGRARVSAARGLKPTAVVGRADLGSSRAGLLAAERLGVLARALDKGRRRSRARAIGDQAPEIWSGPEGRPAAWGLARELLPLEAVWPYPPPPPQPPRRRPARLTGGSRRLCRRGFGLVGARCGLRGVGGRVWRRGVLFPIPEFKHSAQPSGFSGQRLYCRGCRADYGGYGWLGLPGCRVGRGLGRSGAGPGLAWLATVAVVLEEERPRRVLRVLLPGFAPGAGGGFGGGVALGFNLIVLLLLVFHDLQVDWDQSQGGRRCWGSSGLSARLSMQWRQELDQNGQIGELAGDADVQGQTAWGCPRGLGVVDKPQVQQRGRT